MGSGSGGFLCLTKSLNTYSKPLSPLSPPTIHFLLLAIIGNELTSLPLHPHRGILSFFCSGRSGLSPACTFGFVSECILKTQNYTLMVKRQVPQGENSTSFQWRLWLVGQEKWAALAWVQWGVDEKGRELGHCDCLICGKIVVEKLMRS